MADIDTNGGPLAGIPTFDSEACYVYHPPDCAKKPASRPKKRKRVVSDREILEGHPKSLFVSLLDGREKKDYVEVRASLYEESWSEQEDLLQEVLQKSNIETVGKVVDFVDNIDFADYRSQLPTGLIALGFATDSSSLSTAIGDSIEKRSNSILIKVASTQCLNLKSALKHIIRLGINHGEEAAQDGELILRDDQGHRLLNYDLQLLHDHVKKNLVERVVLLFQNSESIEGSVLSDLVDVLSLWQDRIPFVLLFEIATSIELFQEKLSQRTIRRLRGSSFETKDASETLESLFRAATAPAAERLLWLGAGFSRLLLDRHSQYIQSAGQLIQILKYSYITHFFSNPLSVLLDNLHSMDDLQKEHYASIRGLKSFRSRIEELVETKHGTGANRLQREDDFLFNVVYSSIQNGQRSLYHLSLSLDVIHRIQGCLSTKTRISWSKLYIKGMSGELVDSPLIRDLLLSVRQLPSDRMTDLLNKLSPIETLDVSRIQSDLDTLTAEATNSGIPFHSEYDVHHETLRTTVVAQKVSLSRHKSALSKEDATYSRLVDHVNLTLEEFFKQYLIRPKELLLHEIFLYDLKASCHRAFMPLPRHAIEHALSTPHDYLACDCCEGREGGLAASQPPIAILYQLYLESGTLINISDLWSAFYAILGRGEQEGEERDDEEHIMALFYRALAELKYMGFIKNSKKKADHLTKLLWKGL